MNGISLHDLSPTQAASVAEVLRGLQSPQKELPCKLFYDEIGAQFFEQITALDEYYPTRAELRIMRAAAKDIAARLGPECLLIEYGSGSSLKTGPGVDVAKKTITLGILSPYSGPVAAPVGDPLAKGVEVFFDHVNDNGGINGFKVQFLEEDTQYNPQIEVQKYNQIHDKVL